MGQVATPYGLYPRKSLGSRRYTSGQTAFSVTANVATGAMYWGAPVTLIAASVKPIAASPTTTASANSPVGVLNEAYFENLGCIPFNRMIPANAVQNGAKKVTAFVMDDPDLWFMIQADGSLGSGATALDAVGKTASLVNVNQGNAATGRSICALSATSALAAADPTLAVRIVRILDPGAPFPDCLVQWNAAVHQYRNGATALTLFADEEEIDIEKDAREQAKRLDEHGRLRPLTEADRREYKERKEREKEQAAKEAKEREQREAKETKEREQREKGEREQREKNASEREKHEREQREKDTKNHKDLEHQGGRK